jgi:hypothetical protein
VLLRRRAGFLLQKLLARGLCSRWAALLGRPTACATALVRTAMGCWADLAAAGLPFFLRHFLIWFLNKLINSISTFGGIQKW